ncbi:MAG TPA: hypothetical protein VK464_04860 [Symbiobacteriaceae bacterium]|jgi:hypothetical protein|nr:hypothetical protein [Symbiobacteriaceae bacterium]
MSDLLGRPITPVEARLLAVYQELKALRQEPDLAPMAEANLRHALACIWNVVNGLDLEFEQLYDLGV